MSEALYERYKDALPPRPRRGQRGRQDEALDAVRRGGQAGPGPGAAVRRHRTVLAGSEARPKPSPRSTARSSVRRPTSRRSAAGWTSARAGRSRPSGRDARSPGAVLDAPVAGRTRSTPPGAELDRVAKPSRWRAVLLKGMVDRASDTPEAGARPWTGEAHGPRRRPPGGTDRPGCPRPRPRAPPFDPAAAMAAVEDAAESGDPERVRPPPSRPPRASKGRPAPCRDRRVLPGARHEPGGPRPAPGPRRALPRPRLAQRPPPTSWSCCAGDSPMSRRDPDARPAVRSSPPTGRPPVSRRSAPRSDGPPDGRSRRGAMLHSDDDVGVPRIDPRTGPPDDHGRHRDHLPPHLLAVQPHPRARAPSASSSA